MPRGVSVPLIVLLVLGALVGVGVLTAPRIGSQLREVREQVPQAIEQVEGWLAKRQAGAMQLLRPGSDSAAVRDQSERPKRADPPRAPGGNIANARRPANTNSFLPRETHCL